MRVRRPVVGGPHFRQARKEMAENVRRLKERLEADG
jgi:hypothetical protein